MAGDRRIANGRDRLGRRLTVEGVVPVDRKVTTAETGGWMFVYEHKDVGRGGPPRHLHHDQDEWLYALAGEFVVEIGDERLTLRRGDSVLAPRGVPHAWAHATDATGTLLFVAQPAGTMEAFFETIAAGPMAWEELEGVYAAHGMKLLGGPLDVD